MRGTPLELPTVVISGHSTAGVVILGNEGVIRSASAKWFAQLGYSETELAGKPITSILGPGESLEIPATRGAGQIEAIRQDLRWLRKDGTSICVPGVLLSIPASENWLLILTGTDVPCTEQIFRQSEWRFRSFVEHNPDILVVIHADRTFGYMNPAVQKVLGYEPAEVAGWRLEDVLHPDDYPREGEWPMILSRYGSDTVAEVAVRHKDGSWRTLEVVAHNLLHNPVISGVVVYGRDVTKRTEVRRKIRQYAAEAEDRNAAIIGSLHEAISGRGKASLLRLLGDGLLPGVAGIGEFAECLLRTGLDPTQRECAEKIRDSARILSSVVRQFTHDATTPAESETQR